MLAATALTLASASYQLPHGAPPAAARHRAPRPSLGFFEDMKRGFDAGMEGTKAPEAAKAPEGAKARTGPGSYSLGPSSSLLAVMLSVVLSGQYTSPKRCNK